MGAEDRFDRLESQAGKPLPDNVKAAVEKLDRFGHLEIGELKPTSPTAVASPPALPANRILCSHCGQPNEINRDVCWACFKPLKQEQPPKPQVGQDIQLILDGVTYKSSDTNVPHEVRMLMDRIREEGYSEDLLREWREWCLTRNTTHPSDRPFGQQPTIAHDASAVQGQRVSVLRIDGKVYQSDDPNLPPEIRELFDYIDKNGVSQELLEHLRQYGDKVKFRPHTTDKPSDGDVDFWKSVGRRTLETLTTPVPTYGYGSPYGWGYRRPLFIPQTFRQYVITLAISVGVPAIVILWIWWHYFHTVAQAISLMKP